MSKSNTVVIATETVLNGNAVITPQILSFVDRYQTFLRKTAEAILGLAETLVEAEKDLNAVDFLIFCENVGLEKGSPTHSKLKQIGTVSARFRPFVDRLPNTWTTIYKLSKLEPDQFARIAEALTPFSTSKEIDEQLGETREARAPQVFEFKIALGLLDTDSKVEIYNSLLAMKKRFNFEMSETSSVLEVLKTHKLAQAA